jgi:hypothetical protein
VTFCRRFERRPKKLVVSRFMPVLFAIAHYLVVSERFLVLVILGTWLDKRRQKLVVLAIYGRFVDYCTLFWGPREISRAHDTRYTV